MTTDVFAPAKVNLTLHVTGQREDGYHLLDSLVVFVDVGDRLQITEADEMTLQVTGRYREGVPTDNSNLVWRAAEMCGLVADIALEKELPNAAGIGGGSADAAAIIRAAQQLGYSLKNDIASLGADVPVCVSGSPQRMQGIGEKLTLIKGLPDLWMVLVNPRVDTPTPAIFSALKSKLNAGMHKDLPLWSDFGEFCTWLRHQRNDLQDPAIEVQPIINDVLDALTDAELVRMSGSGATCFGLYATAQASANAAKHIQGAHPDWWVVGAKVLKG